MARLRRKEIEDLDPILDTTINYEINEDYFRSYANSTVRPVLQRLSDAWAQTGKRVSWNHVVAIGLKLYSLHRQGYPIDVDLARKLGQKFGITDVNILRAIVNAVSSLAPA
ncbi:MAG: hypothetical protein DRO40_11260 [Thermoprotei archaeon]|nr:MAG: hypothetical protein DRO40_11260 [Thermoprotei archaeon]